MWLYYYWFCGDEIFEMTRLLVGDGLYFGQQLVELEDSDAKISLVAFRVVSQLLHCTREWYSLHWARRSSAGRTRKLLRSSYSWDAAENPQETLKIHADMRYVFKRQNSLPTTSTQDVRQASSRFISIYRLIFSKGGTPQMSPKSSKMIERNLLNTISIKAKLGPT